MPRDSFTVEFWAKTPKYTDRTSGNSFQSFFSYATHTEKDSTCASNPSPLHRLLMHAMGELTCIC